MVKHILADGQIVKDIKKHIVTINDKTVVAYELLSKRRKENGN